MSQHKKMFNPGKDMPNAFLTTTKAGHEVYRLFLNVDEILARLEEGKCMMAIDIPARHGLPELRKGSTKEGKKWQSIPFYAWALEKKKEEMKKEEVCHQ